MFNWTEYLNFAEYLSRTNTSEASIRSGISRAYYSVYHRSKIFCLNGLRIINSYESTGSSCHKLLFDRLIETNDPDLGEIAHRLDTLKQRRQNADYNSSLSDQMTARHLNDTIIMARELINLVNEYNA